ncbi:MAG TPA: aminotransferase class V-fold PLP-dependent enzyme, partial [Terriglobales bacterium]|nr:aminotransferase class V-fold PLP-dependent enzyme [Terriglobales bacterium]
MIYLDNAATSYPKPANVYGGATEFLQRLGANPGRGAHRMAVGAQTMLEETRLELARFFNAGESPERMVFAMNCTDALNMALKGCLLALNARPGTARPIHVITSHLEHNSISRPLHQLERDGMIQLTKVPNSGDGYISPDDVASLVTPATALVALTHCSNVLGTVQPISEIGKMIRDRSQGNALFLVDAAQTAGVEEIDVKESLIDLLAFPGHKALYGFPGTGGLYASPRVDLLPWREGGTGGDSKHPVQPSEFPHRLEGGTHNTVGIASLKQGLSFIMETGRARIRAHEMALGEKLREGLRAISKVTLYGSRAGQNCVSTISFRIDGYSPQDVGAILDESFDIAVRCGLHCAPYCHRQIGTYPDGTTRASI